MVTRRQFLALAGGTLGLAAGCGRDPELTPVPEVAPIGPIFGLAVPQGDPVRLKTAQASLGYRARVVGQFVKLDSTFTLGQLRSLSASGQTPVITVEPWPHRYRSGQVDLPDFSLQAILSHRHDDELRRIAGIIKAYDSPVYLRFAHEMNAVWYPWGTTVNGNSAQLYNAVWHHVHGLISSVAPKVAWVWAPVAGWAQETERLKPMYPGDDVVDFVGATGYGHDGTAEDTFGRWWTEVRTFTQKPAFLPEIGASGPDKISWIESLVPFFQARPDLRGFVWFNTSPATTGATGDYRIDDRPENLAAFRSMLRACSAQCL